MDVPLPVACAEPVDDGSNPSSVYELNAELLVLLGSPVDRAEPVNDDCKPSLVYEPKIELPVLRGRLLEDVSDDQLPSSLTLYPMEVPDSAEGETVGKDECPVNVAPYFSSPYTVECLEVCEDAAEPPGISVLNPLLDEVVNPEECGNLVLKLSEVM